LQWIVDTMGVGDHEGSRTCSLVTHITIYITIAVQHI